MKASVLAIVAALAALAMVIVVSKSLPSSQSAVSLSPVTEKQKMPEYDGATLYKGVPILNLQAPTPPGTPADEGNYGAAGSPPCTIGVYCPPAGWASIWQNLVSRMQKEMSTDTMEIANLKNQVCFFLP